MSRKAICRQHQLLQWTDVLVDHFDSYHTDLNRKNRFNMRYVKLCTGCVITAFPSPSLDEYGASTNTAFVRLKGSSAAPFFSLPPLSLFPRFPPLRLLSVIHHENAVHRVCRCPDFWFWGYQCAWVRRIYRAMQIHCEACNGAIKIHFFISRR